jgi:hypothetical protein
MVVQKIVGLNFYFNAFNNLNLKNPNNIKQKKREKYINSCLKESWEEI